MSLYEQQQEFLDTVFQTKKPAHADVETERIQVYRNNFFASLLDVLKSIYPSVEQIIGEQAFKILSQRFWQEHPPQSPVMLNAGQGFPVFLRAEEQLNSLPYIADVATLDAMHNQAYYAKTCEPLSIEAITDIPPSELANSQFTLLPSLTCLTSEYAIFDIWQLHHHEPEVIKASTIDIQQRQSVIIYNQYTDVKLEQANDGLISFIRTLQNDNSLEQALESAMDDDENFDPSQAVSFLIQNELIVQIQTQK